MRGLVALALALCLPAAASGVERFALVVGNNEGGSSQPRLWFAERDAERFAQVLTDLGGVPPANVSLLRGADPALVRATHARLKAALARARARGEHTLFVFYFSGHASPKALELRGELIAYEELRQIVLGSGADVSVAIVDACSAGSLTQVKGGRPDPAIDFSLPGEESVEGVAFLASTAQGELAQESAALGGSFFSHHLEVALRGAADADGDGQVTLSEAFRFTSARTLSGTVSTQAGPQHPTWATHMSGRGDIVLTDLRRAEAHLLMPADPGALYLLRGPGAFLAEVPGPATPIALALPVGAYQIERRLKDRLEVAQLILKKADNAPMPALTEAGFARSQSKGGSRPFEISAGPAVQTIPLPNGDVALGLEAAVRRAVGPLALRLRVDLGWRSIRDEALLYDYSCYSGALALTWPFLDRRVRLEVGVEGSIAVLTQDFVFGSYGQHVALQGGAGGLLLGSIAVGPVRLEAEVSFAERWFSLDDRVVHKGVGQAALLVGWEL